MINPWFIVGGLVIVISAFFYGHHTGAKSTMAAWEKEKSTANQEAFDKLTAANAQVRDYEQKLATVQNNVEKAYVKKLKAVEIERNNLSALAKSNKLFIDATCENSGSQLPETASGSSVNNGREKARLSREASEFLISIAADADEIVHQLNACQQTLINERELR
jgi:hypothetical protein